MIRYKLIASGLAAALALPGLALAAPVLSSVIGEAYDVEGTPIASVDEALDLIDGAGADASFTVSALDYPAGEDDTAESAETLLSEFLGDDAATLVGSDFTLQQSVFVFTGQIMLAAGEQTFTVGSDDGFRLILDGDLISEFNGSRDFAETSVTADAGVGLVSFMLIFYDDRGDGGLEFSVDGSIATIMQADAVPLPGAIAFMLVGLGGGALLRRQAR